MARRASEKGDDDRDYDETDYGSDCKQSNFVCD